MKSNIDKWICGLKNMHLDLNASGALIIPREMYVVDPKMFLCYVYV